MMRVAYITRSQEAVTDAWLLAAPAKPHGFRGEFVQTATFTEPHIDGNGTAIEAADTRRCSHVRSIFTSVARRFLEVAEKGDVLAFYAEDQNPPANWKSMLESEIMSGAAVAALPQDAGWGRIKAWINGRGLDLSDAKGGPFSVSAVGKDLSAWTQAALSAVLPFRAEVEDGEALAGMRVTLVPLAE